MQSCKSKGMQIAEPSPSRWKLNFQGGNVNQIIRIAGINMHRMDPQSEIIQGTQMTSHVTDSGIIT
jgi:hypothetical protein